MSTRNGFLVLTLTLPLSGCATLGLYDLSLSTSEGNKQNPPLRSQWSPSRAAADSFAEWLVANESYVMTLCASPPGSDLHIDALKSSRFAVSSDPERFAEALLNGYRVARCPRDGQSVADANPPVIDPVEAERMEAKRIEAEHMATVDKWIDRSLKWVFDLGTALFLYGAFNDGEYF